jgi:hypothetical protein
MGITIGEERVPFKVGDEVELLSNWHNGVSAIGMIKRIEREDRFVAYYGNWKMTEEGKKRSMYDRWSKEDKRLFRNAAAYEDQIRERDVI